MVLLAAAVCNRGGKAIVSRQFVEMTRARIEGLLAAFPKLMTTGTGGKQHTYVETESVRYVYQPLESLYVLLITTKASNILEDLETLRLFARVVPEYCRSLDAAEIGNQSFQLLFAFDEIVALGYRENVNLSQIKTFIEMDSHDERVYLAVRETQEREAKQTMKLRAKELAMARKEQERNRVRVPGMGGFGGSTKSSSASSPMDSSSTSTRPHTPYTAPIKSTGGKALKLGRKGKDVDSFVNQLQSEGQVVVSPTKPGLASVGSAAAAAATPAANRESVHLSTTEKITCVHGRGGILSSFEVSGILTLHVKAPELAGLHLAVDSGNVRGAQLQIHPNVERKLWNTHSIVSPKSPSKPFPVGQDIGVVKWRLQTGSADASKDLVPFTLNIWADEAGSGGCEVMVDYELLDLDMELNNVVIRVPTPSGAGAPVVGDTDGDYQYNSRANEMEWTFPVIDSNNPAGSMAFTVPGHEDDFYPVSVDFVSKKSFCNISVSEVSLPDNSRPVKFSSEACTHPERYEYV